MMDIYQYNLSDLLTLKRQPVKVIPDAFYAEIGIYSFGRASFINSQGAVWRSATRNYFLIKEGDFILQVTFAWEGAVGLATSSEEGMYGSVGFPTFRVDEKRCYPPYLINYFRTHTGRNQLIKISPGSAGRNRVLNLKRLSEIIVPLPPLEEQRRIVARIEELAVRIEEARGLRRETVEEVEKLLPSIVTRTLATFEGEARNVTVESIAQSVTDGDHLPPPRTDSGIPFIFISPVVGGKINFSDCKWVSPEYFNSLAANRVAKRGDVLYTAVGSYGVPCLVDTDEPFCFQRHIAIIKPVRNQIIPEFLNWALSSSEVYEQATKAATGSAQLTVPLRGIRKLKFLLPEIPEQHRIVTYLDDLQARVDTLKQLQAETRAELDSLLPSILDKAFKGELV